MTQDSLNVSDYIEVFSDIKEIAEGVDGSDHYGVLYLALGVLFALSKPIIKVLKRWFKIQKDTITKEIKTDVENQHSEFKDVIKQQVSAQKDTINIVKESVEVIKQDGKLRKEQHEDMMNVMNLHIDELGHVKKQVADHSERISSNEKQIKVIKGD